MNIEFNQLLERLRLNQITMQEAIKELKTIKLLHNNSISSSKNIVNNNINELYVYNEPFLRDHMVNDEQVLVGATHVSLAINAFFELYPLEECLQLYKINFIQPIIVKNESQVEVFVETKTKNETVSAEIKYKDSSSNVWNSTATCQLQKAQYVSYQLRIDDLKRPLFKFPDTMQIYQNNPIVKFGESFKIIEDIYLSSNQALARLKKPDHDHHQYTLHPHVINSAFTIIGPILAKNGIKDAYLPFAIKEIKLNKKHAIESNWIFVNLVKNSNEIIVFDASIMTDDGIVVASMMGCTIKRVRNKVNYTDNSVPKNITIKVRQYLESKLSKILNNPSSQLDFEANLMEIGLESIKLVQLANEIEKEINIELYPTVFFEYPNINELVNYFVKEYSDAFIKINSIDSTSVSIAVNEGNVEQSFSNSDDQNYFLSSKGNVNNYEDDIAIIGMSAQFSEANSVNDFWKHLVNKTDLIKEIPLDHWDSRHWYDPNPEALNKTYCKWGSFINDIDKFDAAFFKISPREAMWIDPQLRLLLQNVYASAEDAGCINKLRGTNTGVFVGVCSHDYVDRLTELNLPMNPFVGVGTTQTVFANRISFLFNLTGPSIAYDTACSSSLFALHAACQALRNNECGMAFVGGTNLLMSSQHYRYFSSIKALSFTGRCHSFDASADGYVPGECVASLLLKPLKQAKKDGDRIYAVIKGSAALHGGYTPSLTAPSVAGEENVIIKAWENAKIDPETISYVEAHGTGTKLGDPIEVNALKNAFRKFTKKQNFCAIGSGKANIGHTEGAAGIAGLIKVILQLKHKIIPAMPNFKSLNPYIKLDESALYINRENQEWKTSTNQPRRAGISSFGFSGAYAHIVVEEYIADETPKNNTTLTNFIIILSAVQTSVLQSKIKNLLDFIRENQFTDNDLVNIAYTLQVGREAMDERLAIIVKSIKDLESKLSLLMENSKNLNELDIYRGNIKNALITQELSEETLNDQIEDLIRSKNYKNISELWIKGININWNKLYEINNDLSNIRKISLPTYPFIKEKYWLPQNSTMIQKQNVDVSLQDQTFLQSETLINYNKKPNSIVLTSLPEDKISLSIELENNSASSSATKINQPILKTIDEHTNMVVTANIEQDSNQLQEMLVTSLAEALYIQPKDIKLDKNFSDLGLDSIISAEWIQVINKFRGTSHAAKILYEYPTIHKLTNFLAHHALIDKKAFEHEEFAKKSAQVASCDLKDTYTREEIVKELVDSLSAALFMKQDEINIDKQFSDMGLDSILSVEWINAINKQYDTNFETKVLYDYPTINKLSELILLTSNKNVPLLNNFTKKDHDNDKEKTLSQYTISNEDIAIIGLAGRYPQAQNITEFWQNLLDGKDCIEKIPKERWDCEQYANEKMHDKPYCIWGGFLKDIDKFDSLFFNISPREAEIMDPNARIFLENSWDLLENAGYTKEKIYQTCRNKVGVFVGAMYQHYHLLNSDEAKEAAIAISSYSSIANRISHYFDLCGPSIAIDTMCSSSATAIHMACESLKRGECAMAIAGGINLTLHPKKYLGLSLLKMISSQADLRSFSAGDGFIPSEAVGAALLKTLKNAIRDKDTILAVIKSTAISHRGKSDSFSVPNVNAQVDFMNDHFSVSGIDPKTISYVECGASGNSLADSVELNALTAVFNKYTDRKQFCSIGSVKSNIGHAEAASGISQLSKVVLQLQHQKIVPSIKSTPLNKDINFNSSPFYLQQQTTSWNRLIMNENDQKQELPRRAIINSFGAGGSNVHMILEEYISEQNKKFVTVFQSEPQLIIFSARNINRLHAAIENMLIFITNQPQISLLNLAYTLQIGREEMEARLAVIVKDCKELIEVMKTYLKSSINEKSNINNAFIFSGYVDKNESNNLPIIYPNASTNLREMAEHWCQGGKISWGQFYNDKNVKQLMLPTYPFEKRSCWVGSINESFSKNANGHIVASANQNIPNSVKNDVINIFAKVIGIKPEELKLTVPLSHYGIDSILMTQLFQQLQSQVDPSLEMKKFTQSKTSEDIINSISIPNNIVSIASENESSSIKELTPTFQTTWAQFPELIRLNSIIHGKPVFWFHAGLGGVETYLELAQKSKRPFYGIQARGFMTNRTPLQGVQAMAAYYIHIIQTIQPEGPYDFGGYSFGGGIAYEVTRQLQELGHQINSIVMCDTHDSLHMKKINTTYRSELLQTINTMLGAMVATEPDKILQTMIHRDEINNDVNDEKFLSQLILLAKKRGLNKSKKQLQIMTKQNAKVQKAYDIHRFSVLPLSSPKLLNCYYFRNKSGSFWGPLEPYNIFSSKETMVDGTIYWGEWEKHIPSFHIIDVDSFSHLTLLSQPKTRDTILSFCETLYSGETLATDKLNELKRDIAQLHGLREDDTYNTSVEI